MTTRHHVAILSDIHYASAAEQARGEDYEFRDLKNPLVRLLIRLHSHNLPTDVPALLMSQLRQFSYDFGRAHKRNLTEFYVHLKSQSRNRLRAQASARPLTP